MTFSVPTRPFTLMQKDFEKLVGKVNVVVRSQLNFAMSRALNFAGSELRSQINRDISHVFNANKRTQNAVRASSIYNPLRESRYRPVMKTDRPLNMYIFLAEGWQTSDGLDQSPSVYLSPHAYGNPAIVTQFTRKMRRRNYLPRTGYVIPIHGAKGTRTTSHGKMTAGEYMTALFGIGDFQKDMGGVSGRLSNKFRKRPNLSYFVVPTISGTFENNKRERLSPGIFRRDGKKGITKVFEFVDQVPSFSQSFYWDETITADAPKHYENKLFLELEKYMNL